MTVIAATVSRTAPATPASPVGGVGVCEDAGGASDDTLTAESSDDASSETVSSTAVFTMTKPSDDADTVFS